MSTTTPGLNAGVKDVPVSSRKVPRPDNEAERMVCLRRHQILDTSRAEEFDFLTEMAAQICAAPFTFVTLVDQDRVWVKSCFGMQVKEVPRDYSCCSWAILEPQMLEIADFSQDARTARLNPAYMPQPFRSYTGANLITSDGFNIGTVCVLDTECKQLDAKQKRMLTALAKQAMALIELRTTERELAQANRALEILASTDELTGLRNRRALFAQMELELKRSARFHTPVSVLMLDIDHFKRINDSHGHGAGDAVLRAVGDCLRVNCRVIDISGRYGGEELCVMLPETDAAGARHAAETLRGKIAALSVPYANETLTVTVSIGLAAAPLQTPYELSVLLQAADNALYRAKAGGRNCVCGVG